MPDRVQIAGVEFDNVTEDEALETVRQAIQKNRPFYVVTPNPEFVLEAQKNQNFKKILNEAVLAIPDGTGILWAASWLKCPSPLAFSLVKALLCPSSIRTILRARVTGTDLMEKVIDESQKTGWRIFLLGGRGDVAEKAQTILMKKYPGANLVGSFSGEGGPSGDTETVARVTRARPDILFVAYGGPKQEEWIGRNLKNCHSVRMTMGVGGAFDFISGKTKRAPGWIRKIGLEWLHRLLCEPWRMARIWRATVQFIGLIRQEQLKKIDTKKKK